MFLFSFDRAFLKFALCIYVLVCSCVLSFFVVGGCFFVLLCFVTGVFLLLDVALCCS